MVERPSTAIYAGQASFVVWPALGLGIPDEHTSVWTKEVTTGVLQAALGRRFLLGAVAGWAGDAEQASWRRG